MGFARKIQRKQFVQQRKALQKIARYKRRYWYVRSIKYKPNEEEEYTIYQEKDFSVKIYDKNDVLIGHAHTDKPLTNKGLCKYVEIYLKLLEKQNEGEKITKEYAKEIAAEVINNDKRESVDSQ